MADIELVIKIPEEKYERLLYQDIISLRSYVENGTVLPKGHGRLIDADAVDTRYSDPEVVETLNEAPTILEADKAESEVENAE